MFKIKFAAGSKSLIIIISNYVYKISLNIFSLNNYVSYEYKKISIVKNDNFWNKFLPNYIYITYFLTQTNYYKENIERNKKILYLIRENIQKSKKKYKFKTIFNSEKFLNYNNFSEYIKSININLYNELFDKHIIISSVHGDFHEKNILFKKDKLRIIDWINYQKNFWYKYDYYHYYIVDYSQKYSYSFKDCVINIKNIFNYLVTVDNYFFKEFADLKIYIVCRVFLELKLSNNIKKFKNNKIVKYNEIIKII